MPARKAVDCAEQIARGLAAAHEKGIVHRDLKPENVFLTTDGRLKILDFGLAKLTEPDRAVAGASSLPTVAAATDPGMVLGTIGYMSPEQVRGVTADHRADVFACGAVLYEMLSGRRAFRGATTADTMTAILKEDPPDLPADRHISSALERIVDRCLEKNPASRFQSAGDLAFALEGLSSHSETTSVATATSQAATAVGSNRRATMSWATATSVSLLATIALGVAYVWRAPVITPMMRFSVSPPENSAFFSLLGAAGTSGSVSPDGRHLAFVASTNSGAPMLWVRSLDALAPRMLPGTEGAGSPFWSPDSRSLAFFSNNGLLRIDVAGGPPQVVCHVSSSAGGTWGRAGVILFAEGNHIKRVAATGGEPTEATTLDVQSMWPNFLPDGRHFLYRSTSGGIYLASLDAPAGQRLLDADTNAVYAPPGYLLFMRQDVLLALSFDPTNLKVAGDPIRIADHVASDPAAGRGAFSASKTGILTYRGGGGASVTQLTWFDRAGKPVGVLGQPGPYSNHAISPDGTRVAVERRDTAATNIWIFDRARGTPSRFTFNTVDLMPTWSPDGARIVFGSIKPGGVVDLYQKSSGGAGEEELLFKSASPKLPTDWSSDGRHLVYFDLDSKGGGYDVWVLPMVGDRPQPIPFLRRPFSDVQGTMSPDGRWIAYASNESGRVEVYVQSFPASGGKWQISTNGGSQPKWRRDGKELFFLAAGATVQAVAVDVQGAGAGKDFRAGVPRPLFKIDIDSTVVRNSYDVTADGQQFLVNVLTPTTGTSAITVVTNWTAGLRK